jgi:NTE family protein
MKRWLISSRGLSHRYESYGLLHFVRNDSCECFFFYGSGMSEIASSSNRKKIALVIGAGNVKCAAALGLWKVLAREGVEIDLYVGCSGGSLFSSTMALGFEVEESIEITQRLWNRKITEKKNMASLLKAFLPFFEFDGRFGMIDDGEMMKSLNTVFGGKTFEDTQVPLHIVATDFLDGEQVVFNQGALVDAIRASISVPYIWKPWQIGNRPYVDGSLSNPMPVDVAIKQGAEIILAVGFESPFPKQMKSLTRFAFHVNTIMENNLLRANYAFHNLAHHAEIIAIFPGVDRPINLFDTHEIPHVIDRGEDAMEEQLPYLLQILEGIPDRY